MQPNAGVNGFGGRAAFGQNVPARLEGPALETLLPVIEPEGAQRRRLVRETRVSRHEIRGQLDSELFES